MRLNKNFIYYFFALTPIFGLLVTTFFKIAVYNALSGFAWISLILFLFEINIKKKKFIFPSYLKYLFIFIIYTLISDYILANKEIDIKYIYSNYLLSGFIITLVIENSTFTKNQIKNLSYLNISILIFAFVVILIQQLFDLHFLVNTDSEEILRNLDSDEVSDQRLPSIFSWSSMLDINFGFIGVITLIISQRLLRKNKEIITIFYIIIALIFSFLSKGRWIMINALLIVIMFVRFKGISFLNIIKYTFIGFIILLSLDQTMVFLEIPVNEIVTHRIFEEDKGGVVNGSGGTRIFALEVFLKLFPNNYIFGKGMLHSFNGESKDIDLVRELEGRSSQIHVGYLSLLYYYGILGASFYILFVIKLMKKLYNEAKSTHFWGTYYVFFGFTLSNFTLVSFPIFAYGLVLSLLFNKYYKDNYSLSNNSLKI